jgi:hypothetical protein
MKFIEGICLGENRFPERFGRVATFWGFINKEKNFVHGELLLLRQ